MTFQSNSGTVNKMNKYGWDLQLLKALVQILLFHLIFHILSKAVDGHLGDI